MQYMVRVELYGPAHVVRDILHAVMAAASFERVLTDEATGSEFETLTGTYVIDTKNDLSVVLEAARFAAQSVHPNVGIMAAAGPIAFYNCPETRGNKIREVGR
jgi:hypothetical protein